MFDAAWNDVYSTKAMAKYPDTALVRFIAKHYYDVPHRGAIEFLDVGCGAGASVWYLAREGFTVTGIDGSYVAVQRANRRLNHENLSAYLLRLDVESDDIPGEYDCIIDISSLCYVHDVSPVMTKLRACLMKYGKFFSICPSDTCERGPFEIEHDGFSLKPRYSTLEEVKQQFEFFPHVKITPMTYVVSSGAHVSLWVTEAILI